MNRFKTYAFWVALSGAIVILVQSLGKLFGFEVESGIIENVVMSICGVLVVLGIVTKANSSTEETIYKNPNIVVENQDDFADKGETTQVIVDEETTTQDSVENIESIEEFVPTEEEQVVIVSTGKIEMNSVTTESVVDFEKQTDLSSVSATSDEVDTNGADQTI